MFTGIIEEVGTVKDIRMAAHSAVISVSAVNILEGTRIGDSIAVNGVCLTVVSLHDGEFSADATPETVSRTSLDKLRRGSHVNLERAMAADGRFGGHIVMGHVDGCGIVSGIVRDGNSLLLSVKADPGIMRYVVTKGSIAIDGISLTVAAVSQSGFTVSVIPHTAESTDIRYMKRGDAVNIETDIIGKYAEKFLLAPAGKTGGITMEMLTEHGFGR